MYILYSVYNIIQVSEIFSVLGDQLKIKELGFRSHIYLYDCLLLFSLCSLICVIPLSMAFFLKYISCLEFFFVTSLYLKL